MQTVLVVSDAREYAISGVRQFVTNANTDGCEFIDKALW
jgi:hypothetical protein